MLGVGLGGSYKSVMKVAAPTLQELGERKAKPESLHGLSGQARAAC